MGAAALAVVAHVPDPRRSGTVASVYDPHESCTLAFALAQTGVSLATVAGSAGVSKSRAAQWTSGEAEPHLGHVRRMPASVRRAIGQQLLGGAQVIPVPRPLWDKALLRLLARISEMASRAADAERDPRARAALLREIHAAREDLARLEAGVLATEAT